MGGNFGFNKTDILSTENNDNLEYEHHNEDLDEAFHCENIAGEFEPYHNKNILPFNLYIKDDLPIIYEALIELERVRPKNPVEFFCVYILDKQNSNNIK